MDNQQIAEALGWERKRVGGTADNPVYSYVDGDGYHHSYLTDFYHDISAAWILVEEMRGRGYELLLSVFKGGGASALFYKEFNPNMVSTPADTTPEAICKAFMEVMGG